MSFLLDTNICSAHLRRPGGLAHRFFQYQGRLNVSAVALGELYAGAYLAANPRRLLGQIARLIDDVTVIPLDAAAAEAFGRLRRERGRTVNPLDLLIASTAVAHRWTLVTHNVRQFAGIPDLALEDWLADG